MSDVLQPRSLSWKGHRTSIRLDDDTWSAFNEICAREGETHHSILGLIQRSRAPQESLTNATRRFALNYYRRGFLATLLTSLQPARSDLIARLGGHLENAVLRRTLTEAWGDHEQKLQLALTSLEEIEDGRIPLHWQQWLALRARLGRTPSFDEFSPLCSPSPTEDDCVNLIDVTPENPARFRADQVNSGIAGIIGRPLSGTTIGEFPFAIHAEGMQIDFNAAKMNALPAYHVIRQRFGDHVRTYSRLILPFAGPRPGAAGPEVERLMSVVHRIEPIHDVVARKVKRPRPHLAKRMRRA